MSVMSLVLSGWSSFSPSPYAPDTPECPAFWKIVSRVVRQSGEDEARHLPDGGVVEDEGQIHLGNLRELRLAKAMHV